MKICWDNLEKLRYNQKTGKLYKDRFNENGVRVGMTPYLFSENPCMQCGEDFLCCPGNECVFCNFTCETIYRNFNTVYTKERCANVSKGKLGKSIWSEEDRKQMSIDRKGRFLNDKNPQWKGGFKKNGVSDYDSFVEELSLIEECRRCPENNDLLEVKCTYCGSWHNPPRDVSRHRIRSLNGLSVGENRFYCSEHCKRSCSIFGQRKYPKGFKQSTSREVQAELRKMRFEFDNWTCQKCGKHQSELNVPLHCHHLEGIRWEPIESADLDKCLTMCETCHHEAHGREGCKNSDMWCKE